MTDQQQAPLRRARLRIVIGAAAVLLLVALGSAVLFSALAPRGGGSTVSGGFPQGVRATASAPAASGAPGGAAIFVHILGAVNRPGLYELREGARAVDVVAAAGGFGEAADQSQINLARFVTDGEQIVVPVVGAVPPAASGPPGAGGGEAAPGAKVNINTADAAGLEVHVHPGDLVGDVEVLLRELPRPAAALYAAG